MTYHYLANGIPIESELEFKELPETFDKPIILIKYGKTPKNIKNIIYRGATSFAGGNEYLLRVNNVATYYLEKKGNRFFITIQPEKDVLENELRIFVLSSIMGAVAHMQGFFPLHASGVNIGGKAFLFCGASGIGKSTLCAALYQKGYPFITDNLANLFSNQKGDLMVYPSYNHIRLWSDSIKELKEFENDGVKMREEIEKYNMLLTASLPSQPITVGGIFILRKSFDSDISMELISGRVKSDMLVSNTFRIKLLNAIGDQKEYFKILNIAANKVPILKLQRPISQFRLSDLSQCVLEKANELVSHG